MSIFFGASGGASSSQAAQQTAWIPFPEARTFLTQIDGGDDNYKGGSFIVEKPVSFNRVIIRLDNIPATETALGRFLIYQQSDGGISDSVPLVGSFDFSATEPPGTVTITSALNEGTVELVRGLCWALYGRRVGSSAFDVIAYKISEGNQGFLLNFSMVSGTHPVTFNTNVDADTTPSTFNPLEGGGTVTGVPADRAIVWRVFTV